MGEWVENSDGYFIWYFKRKTPIEKIKDFLRYSFKK